MSFAGYLFDEHVPHPLIGGVRRAEAALTLHQVGRGVAPARGTPDPELLAWIEAHDCMLVTANRLSGLISRAGGPEPVSESMPPMIECLLLLSALLRAAVRDGSDLVTENLLLRHQLAVLTTDPQAPAAPRVTSWSRCWPASPAATGAGTSSWSRPGRSFGGTPGPGGCSGVGGRAPRWAVRVSAPRSGI